MVTVLTAVSSKPNLDIIIGIGIVLIIAGCGTLVKAVHLREFHSDRLSKKIDIAFSGLTENAISSLRVLTSEIEKHIPLHDNPFDPLILTTDPVGVIKPAKNSIKLIKERRAIKRDFKRLLISCSLLKYFILVFTACSAVSTCFYSFVFNQALLWKTGMILTFSFGIVIGFTYLWFMYLEQRIQRGIADGSVADDEPAVGVL